MESAASLDVCCIVGQPDPAGAAVAGAGPAALAGAFQRTVQSSPLAFVLMLGAAVLWGLYTNLARRLGREGEAGDMPLLALGAGLLFLLLRMAAGERSDWSGVSPAALTWFAVGICGLSYAAWDLAVRRGDMVLLGAVAYFTPVGATAFAAWYLGSPLGWSLLAGSLLIVAGAVLSKVAFSGQRSAVSSSQVFAAIGSPRRRRSG